MPCTIKSVAPCTIKNGMPCIRSGLTGIEVASVVQRIWLTSVGVAFMFQSIGLTGAEVVFVFRNIWLAGVGVAFVFQSIFPAAGALLPFSLPARRAVSLRAGCFFVENETNASSQSRQ